MGCMFSSDGLKVTQYGSNEYNKIVIYNESGMPELTEKEFSMLYYVVAGIIENHKEELIDSTE